MRSLFFTCLCVASFAAVAAGADTRKPLEVATVVSQQKQIRDDLMIRKGRYKDMPDSTRVELLSKQAELLTMLEGKRTAADLSEEQQMQAFNTLEWIEAAINNADDERVICRREKVLGSTRTTRVCRTAEYERRAREKARESMERGVFD
jgi:hypothetical protein